MTKKARPFSFSERKWLRHTLRIGFPILMGGAILWWMYRGFDWDVFRQAVSHDMNWTWMILSLPFGILAQVFRATRWQQLLQPMGERPRLHTSICAIFISYGSSLVVPRSGEVLRCGVLNRYDGVSFSPSLGTVVTERVVDMICIIFLSALVFLLQVPVFFRFFAQTGISLSTYLGQFTETGYLVTGISILFIILTALWLTKRIRKKSPSGSMIDELLRGITSLAKVRNKGLFAFYSLAIWASYFLHFYLTFFCFGFTAEVGMKAAMVAFIIGTFAVLVPTPNGAGPWHFAVKTVLMLFGVPGENGAIFALIVHSIQTLLVALLGLYGFAALAGMRAKHQQQL